jgi:hypothetical protein
MKTCTNKFDTMKLMLVEMILYPSLIYGLQILWEHVTMKNKIYNNEKNKLNIKN